MFILCLLSLCLHLSPAWRSPGKHSCGQEQSTGQQAATKRSTWPSTPLCCCLLSRCLHMSPAECSPECTPCMHVVFNMHAGCVVMWTHSRGQKQTKGQQASNKHMAASNICFIIVHLLVASPSETACVRLINFLNCARFAIHSLAGSGAVAIS